MLKRAQFRLRFPEADIARWATRFGDDGSDDEILGNIRPLVLARGHLTRPEFLKICAWKSVRTKSSCRRNGGHNVETLTRAAFATPDEALKISLLRLLDGVEWPTASTILHFCDTRAYPILDYRALWSLGFANPPRYAMEFWLAYLAFTRGLALRLGVPIRTVDKALWQYSKERQKFGSTRSHEGAP
ncbi:MAG: hypothetical protein E6K79_09115 [Candidatus Eisenbacteria bacterium]|uniref:Uncharacterized protein n=1 Tax=Eiseniibacteriota bacterium TaxID=2212470 RepID=A0A538TJJ7_UNCEI|nr:MAG: hypothetical protein E6K79_09115 [Candidatus Eisenbacteria bacterium]